MSCLSSEIPAPEETCSRTLRHVGLRGCMRVWGKLGSERTEVRGVARAILAGALRQELVTEAVRALLAEGNSDRIGVWIEANEEVAADAQGIASFRGIAADADGAAIPGEWSRLSPAALPRELLMGLRSVEQELLDSSSHPVIGAIVEMRNALWVPVETRGHLHGVILACARKKHATLPKTFAETVAVELALALEVDDERRVSRERQQDFASVRSVLAALASAESPEAILRRLVEDCTARGENGVGPDAVFAAIGEWGNAEHPAGVAPQEVHSEEQKQEFASSEEARFRWSSGDAAWTRALESEPLSRVWRQAVNSQRAIGSEPSGAWSHRGVASVVAFPLRSGPENLGVLVAGMRRGSASLSTLERLELRAGLAVSALLRRKQTEEEIQLKARKKGALGTAAAGAAQAHQPPGGESPNRARTS